jgi:hypothetical protein
MSQRPVAFNSKCSRVRIPKPTRRKSGDSRGSLGANGGRPESMGHASESRGHKFSTSPSVGCGRLLCGLHRASISKKVPARLCLATLEADVLFTSARDAQESAAAYRQIVGQEGNDLLPKNCTKIGYDFVG